MSGNSKVKNDNPDDFPTYLAKRKAADEGRVWTPGGAPAAAPAAAAPAAAAPAASNSKVKNDNPDDFPTYLAKRQAAAEGRVWTPGGGAPAAAAPAAAAPAASNSKVKNENPDDFPTYLAKRKAAEAGVTWTPGYK